MGTLEGFTPKKIDTRTNKHAWGTVDGHAVDANGRDLGEPACPKCLKPLLDLLEKM